MVREGDLVFPWGEFGVAPGWNFYLHPGGIHTCTRVELLLAPGWKHKLHPGIYINVLEADGKCAGRRVKIFLKKSAAGG